MSILSDLERGQYAKEVLENPVYVEAMSQIREEITTRWASEADADKRDHLWRMLQCHKRLEASLSDTMTSGKLASKLIQAEQSRKEKILGTFRRAA